MIRRKYHDGVFIEPLLFQGVENPTNLIIHAPLDGGMIILLSRFKLGVRNFIIVQCFLMIRQTLGQL